MQTIYPELQRLGAEVLVVSFTPPARVAAYVAKYPQPFLVVSDPTRAGYRAFDLDRTTVGSLFRPGVIGRYLKHMVGGWLPKKPGAGEDVLQLGGDFLLDQSGVLRYAHPSKEPTDRPSAAEIVEQVKIQSRNLGAPSAPRER